MHGRTAWWGTSVKTIKQGWDDGMCAVCVCAMATGSTTQDVYDFFGNDREYGEPITACEVAMFLMSRGKVLGGGHGAQGRRLNQYDPLIHSIRGWPAYVVVASEIEGTDHALYWDGRYLRDPWPGEGVTSKWEDYDVLFVYPLGETEAVEQCKRLVYTPGPTPEHVLEWRSRRLAEATLQAATLVAANLQELKP